MFARHCNGSRPLRWSRRIRRWHTRYNIPNGQGCGGIPELVRGAGDGPEEEDGRSYHYRYQCIAGSEHMGKEVRHTVCYFFKETWLLIVLFPDTNGLQSRQGKSFTTLLLVEILGIVRLLGIRALNLQR